MESINISILLIIGVAFAVIFLIVFICSIIFDNPERQLTRLGNAAAKAQYNIISQNEKILKETADKSAHIHKDAIETVVHSVKKGWSEEENNYCFCKHCGEKNDTDAVFCKSCGRKI